MSAKLFSLVNYRAMSAKLSSLVNYKAMSAKLSCMVNYRAMSAKLSSLVNYKAMSAKQSCMARLDHADIKEAACKMTQARGIDDQENESVEGEQVDSTMLKAQICSSPGCASVQRSEGESIRMGMNELSVPSNEDKIEQESVEEMASDDEEKNTPLARCTGGASKPQGWQGRRGAQGAGRQKRAPRGGARGAVKQCGALLGSMMMSILFDWRVRTGSAWPGRGPVIYGIET
jgi:hypothetical protein